MHKKVEEEAKEIVLSNFNVLKKSTQGMENKMKMKNERIYHKQNIKQILFNYVLYNYLFYIKQITIYQYFSSQ
jgi:hypothetical protein